MTQANTSRTLRIATRKSALALWQAEYVKAKLLEHHPRLQVELVPMSTQGDKILDTPLAKIGGKGLFIKELEIAMLEGRADIAVHSMKDVPIELPSGLEVSIYTKRAEHRDVLIARNQLTLDKLPKNAIIGTSSLRRIVQLKRYRSDFSFVSLRGNVGSRLKKLSLQNLDAIILAGAGINRLKLNKHISEYIEPTICLPAIAQGVISIETRVNDIEVMPYIKHLNHKKTKICILAERSFQKTMNGSCQVPLAAYATLKYNRLDINGFVASPENPQEGVSCSMSAKKSENEEVGKKLAIKLLNLGADKILDQIGITPNYP